RRYLAREKAIDVGIQLIDGLSRRVLTHECQARAERARRPERDDNDHRNGRDRRDHSAPNGFLLRASRESSVSCHATTGAANAGALTSIAAPRSRGCSSAPTITISGAAAAGVSARSARPVRTMPSIRSQAVVISPL